MGLIFKDRTDAGLKLAEQLAHYEGREDLIALALPRGGVPVAYEVAKRLKAPMEVFLVRKLGVPGHEELAMGAIASGGVEVLNEDVVQALGIPIRLIEAVSNAERKELERREHLYRGGRPFPDLKGLIVILIDDGLATGASMRAAIAAVRALGPARIVVAIPTAAPETYTSIKRIADEIVCLITPQPFFGVGYWYEDFTQISDKQVRLYIEGV